jgi:Icc-related predicted phosphoesterase
MRLLIFADLHDGLDKSEVDVLKEVEFDTAITLGDIGKDSLTQIKEICGDRKIIGVMGENDADSILEKLDIINTHNKITEIDGIKFLGFSGCLPYQRMDSVYLHSQLECSVFMDMANEADIVISHNAPFDIHDDADNHAYIGYKGLVEYMDRVKPILLLHGHQHVNRETMYEGTAVIGVYGVRLIDTDILYPGRNFDSLSSEFGGIHFKNTRDLSIKEY